MIVSSSGIGESVFAAGLVLAVLSFIAGLIIPCMNTPHKWLKALLVGIGLPIIFLAIAFAGCAGVF